LVLNQNQIVRTETAIEELWGPRPPRSAKVTVQTYVLHLRRFLDGVPEIADSGGARRLLATWSHGYRFAPLPCEVDVQRYENVVAQGRKCLARGEFEAAGDFLSAASSTWRGPALHGVSTGRHLGPHRARLDESRLVVTEQRIEVELRCGRPQAVISELHELVRDYPTHENLRAQLMVAWYRHGGRDAALRVYADLCEVLDTDFGLPPSARLRRLYEAVVGCEAVLYEDPAIDAGELTIDLGLRTSRRAVSGSG